MTVDDSLAVEGNVPDSTVTKASGGDAENGIKNFQEQTSAMSIERSFDDTEMNDAPLVQPSPDASQKSPQKTPVATGSDLDR